MSTSGAVLMVGLSFTSLCVLCPNTAFDSKEETTFVVSKTLVSNLEFKTEKVNNRYTTPAELGSESKE